MLTVSQAFDVLLARLTPTEAQRSTGASHRQSVSNALSGALPLISMFESGSFSHGTGVRGHSDIDVFACMEFQTQPTNPWDALESLRAVLKARFSTTPMWIDPPAVVVAFGGGYERWEVIPAYISERGFSTQQVFYIPSHKWVGGWIYSAPKVHLEYVNACNERPNHGNAKALARLVKGWRYANDVTISSFYFEMKAVEYVARQSTFIPVFDLSGLLSEMEEEGLAPIPDPSGLTDEIRPCRDGDDLSKAQDALSISAYVAQQALKQYLAKDAGLSFAYLSQLFGDSFPSRYDDPD